MRRPARRIAGRARRGSAARALAGAAIGVLLVAPAGCAPGRQGAATTSGTCLPPPGPPATTSVEPGPNAGEPLPELALPCFDGSGVTPLDELPRPAVVTLWASWCQPCRVELPAFQRLAERAAGRLVVIGVNTSDDRGTAQAVIDEFGLTFPMLSDERKQLLTALGRSGLPATLFVSGDGRIAYLHNAQALDDAALTGLVADHLGVAVPA